LAILLAAAQQGDRESYAAFLTEAASLLRGYVGRRIADPEVVEDILQEILIAVHRSRHTHVPGRPVGPWLYAISDHRVSDAVRRLRRIEANEVALLRETLELARELDREPSDDRGVAIHEALARLPNVQRSVIEMLKVDDLSVREVAASTGMSESSVKVTAFRGYKAVRRMLGVRAK
jgi:RNA polymerase sigma-70 factor, ECF subfamily